MAKLLNYYIVNVSSSIEQKTYLYCSNYIVNSILVSIFAVPLTALLVREFLITPRPYSTNIWIFTGATICLVILMMYSIWYGSNRSITLFNNQLVFNHHGRQSMVPLSDISKYRLSNSISTSTLEPQVMIGQGVWKIIAHYAKGIIPPSTPIHSIKLFYQGKKYSISNRYLEGDMLMQQIIEKLKEHNVPLA